MSSFPSTSALKVMCLPSGEKLWPLISHLSFVIHRIFFVLTSNNPMLSYPFSAFDVTSTCLPSGPLMWSPLASFFMSQTLIEVTFLLAASTFTSSRKMAHPASPSCPDVVQEIRVPPAPDTACGATPANGNPVRSSTVPEISSRGGPPPVPETTQSRRETPDRGIVCDAPAAQKSTSGGRAASR